MLSIDLAAPAPLKHKSSFVALMKEKHGSNDFVFADVVVPDAKSKSNGSIGRRRRRRRERPARTGRTDGQRANDTGWFMDLRIKSNALQGAASRLKWESLISQ